jgi:erythromycin esterase
VRARPVLFAAAILTAAPSSAVASDDDRVAWLAEHAVAFSTLDPRAPGLADLAPLRELLGGVRVVMLGEASRSDGSTFLAKTRLVRFLHQELGFDVVVFESGFYEAARAWQAVRAGADVRGALAPLLFPAYREAVELQPLLDYLAARAKSERPLEFAGIDPQMGGTAGSMTLIAELRGLLERSGVAAASVPGFDELEAALDDLLLERYLTGDAAVPPRARQRRVLGALAEIRRRLAARPATTEADDVRVRAFWLQVLDNLETCAELGWRQGRWVPGSPFSAELHNLRDRRMARNLVWLARERYRGRKLIVWSINIHLARDLDRLTTRDAGTRALLDGMSSIGDTVAKELGEEAYTIAATAFAGHLGSPSGEPAPLLTVTAGSFEELMARTGVEAALVDLRRPPPGGSWLGRSLLARPISYKELLAIWPRHVDALLFLRTTHPTRRAPG